jgi:hypothetical protein
MLLHKDAYTYNTLHLLGLRTQDQSGIHVSHGQNRSVQSRMNEGSYLHPHIIKQNARPHVQCFRTVPAIAISPPLGLCGVMSGFCVSWMHKCVCVCVCCVCVYREREKARINSMTGQNVAWGCTALRTFSYKPTWEGHLKRASLR